jgi:hypothetical protein
MSEERKVYFEKITLSTPLNLLELKEERQVLIHGIAKGFQRIQIHKNPHLVCYKNHIELRLLFSYGIPTYPEFSEGVDQKFTLIFESLPEDCTSFYFQSVPESGTWISYDFERNDEDVYFLTIL